MSSRIHEIIDEMKRDHAEELIHHRELPPTLPNIADIPEFLHQNIKEWLKKQRITLYSHQAEALELLNEGNNVIITTPTASGKSLIYQLIVFDAILKSSNATALYLSPLKALARDQEKALKALDRDLNARAWPATYDGDTSRANKRKIRMFSKIILSNPHAMHQYLDWHPKWRRFYSNLRYIIIDEAHAYRGIFGSGVAHLLRRMRRIARYYGSTPQFILLSATLGNSLEFAERLVGMPFVEVKQSGAPMSTRHFLIWNPRLIDKASGLRASTFMDSAKLLAKLVENHVQALLFVDSRKMTELISSWTKEMLAARHPKAITSLVASYRAGYHPRDRRSLEERIKDKTIMGIASTSALELGIDVGTLDAVILVGYPGSIMQTWQRVGRAGRKQQEALICLVCHNNPLDQYIARHPEHLFQNQPERAVISLTNPLIMRGHLLCAARELPLTIDDFSEYWPEIEDPLHILQELKENNLMKKESHGGWVFSGNFRPSSVFTIQGMLPAYLLMVGNNVLEVLDEQHAYEQAFPEAIYLHQGEQYLIEDVDHEKKVIRSRPVTADYYTEIVKQTDVDILKELNNIQLGALALHVGEVEVIHDFPGFHLKQYDQIIDTKWKPLGSRAFETEGLWFEPFAAIQHRWWELFEKQPYMAAGLHAAEHAIIHVFPTFSLCDANDIGGVSYAEYLMTGNPTIFIYEGHHGGTGLLREAASLFPLMIKRALELVMECPCTSKSGCPACIQDRHCGNDNYFLSKDAGIEVLSWLEMQLDSRTPTK